MTSGKVITSVLHRVQRGHGRGYVEQAPRDPVERPARVAVMLALAHKIREAITQHLDLLRLAPDL